MNTGLPQHERFSNLPVPIHKVTAKTPEEMFQQLPGLRRYFEKPRKIDEKGGIPIYDANYRGLEPGDLVKVFKYIFFLYDPETELTQEFPDDLQLRKDAAAREAGFKRMENGDWPPHILDIMHLKEPAVLQWIVDFLRVRKNSTWMEIKFLEEEIDGLYRKRQLDLARGDINRDTAKYTKERKDELDLQYKKFYADHKDLKDATHKDNFPVTPENVFKLLEIPEEFWKIRQVKDVPKEAQPH